MQKGGANDEAAWERLKAVRLEIDALYDEKQMLVHKIYNLT